MSKAVQKTAQLYSSAEKMMQNFPADFICDKNLYLSPSASFDVPTSKLADKIITPPWRAGIKGWVKANHHPPDPLPFRKGKTIMSKAVQKTAQLYSSAEKKMMQNFPADFICDKSLFRLCQ